MIVKNILIKLNLKIKDENSKKYLLKTNTLPNGFKRLYYGVGLSYMNIYFI